jgi:hypothetical protein
MKDTQDLENQPTHTIIVCDTFSNEDYPVHVYAGQNLDEIKKQYDNVNMQRIVAVIINSKSTESHCGQIRTEPCKLIRDANCIDCPWEPTTPVNWNLEFPEEWVIPFETDEELKNSIVEEPDENEKLDMSKIKYTA